jgi:ribosomal protein L37AE/L43A
MTSFCYNIGMSKQSIQFQKGLSINNFMSNYGTETKCKAALEQARYCRGYSCPKCGKTTFCIVYHRGIKTWQCNHCHNQTTLTAGTIFHNSKLSLFTWFYAFFMLTQSKNNVSALEMARTLGVCYRTAWRLKHKITQVMLEREDKRILVGRIEIDDAYLGGEKSGTKVGRGSPNKIPFIAAVQTENGRPKFAIYSRVKAFTSVDVEQWAMKRIKSGSVVVSDGFPCFNAVRKAGCYHTPFVVGAGNKSTKMACFMWVNTLLGNLKTSMSGTYHSVKYDKYTDRYLGESQYRFNRRFDMKDMFIRLVYASVQTGIRNENWLRA